MMNKKKITLVLASIMFAIIFMVIPNKASAATTITTPLYFGIQEFRTGTTPENMAYAINNPYDNGATTESIVGAKLWQIVKYNSKTDSNYTSGNYYCVRAGVGFADVGDIAEYNISYDFKTEKSAIAASGNAVLQSIVNNGYYNNLLALVDLMYLNGVSTDAERTALLEAAQIHDEDYTAHITNSDIEAVQQAAVWYFSNHDDELFEKVYNNLGNDKTSWLFYRTLEMSQAGEGYKSLSDYNMSFNDNGEKIGDGKQRQEQAVLLYNYLINKANENSVAYQNGTANSRTKITLYANATEQNVQPIILIEKLPEEVKEFDLSLRKYVTKINGKSLTGAESRVPSIDESTLKTGTEATYKHRKDPVVIETGDVVTYNLTVYNEGDKLGRATKIVDQLSDGLEFSKINTNGFTVNYDEANNKLTITRDANNTTNIEAYKENNLKSETIEIECVVTAKPDTKNQKILTNVAWIAEEFDAEDNVTITNQTDADRDSQPSVTPNVNKDNMSDYTGNSNNKKDLTDSNYYYKGQQDDDDFEKLLMEPATFDLKLIKRVVEINGVKVPERIEDVDITALANGTATTATYKVNTEPVAVKDGDIVKYTFRVYNEGDIDGYASEISEDIPDGLEFVWSEKTDDELESDASLSKIEKQAIKYNQGIWDIKNVDSKTNKVELIATDYLAKGKGAEISTSGANLIKAFDSSKAYTNKVNDKNPDYKEVSVYLKVTAKNATSKIIKNEAAITGDTDADGNPVDDRDSDTDKWIKYEDDEDYDSIILQSFDLSLRKFLIAVSKDTTIENSEYLKDKNGIYTRAPKVDTSKLNTTDENGKIITTATYTNNKEPVEVAKNDIVVYMIRAYNEGDLDGYASEVTDYLPPYLEYVEGEFNEKYGWKVSKDGRIVTTTYLENHLISKTTTNDNGEIVLSYKEVPIMCKVKSNAEGKITNIAEITVSKDENKKEIDDRDSKPNDIVLPDDKDLPDYKEDETGNYIPGQEDDDDFEKIVVKKFDLALRKFLTGVNDKEVTSRIPTVKYDKENSKIVYEHSKEPVDVVIGNTVIYTIRVYNEGELDGFASKVTDNIPDGLEYLPENELNKEYRWVMYDEDGNETTDINKATKITTDYLSKKQGEERMKKNSELKENPALLTAFDSSKDVSDTNPDFADVKVAFKVVEPKTSNETKNIINYAQISDDTDKNGNPVDDDDSTPDKWIDGDDDQDEEHIKINYFDLSLKKWVTQAIVIENGKETVTQTGNKPEDPTEQVVKVEVHRKKVKSITVKFRYSIRVTNEGDIAGYAKEIKDYVPEGLKFVAEDNADWKDEGNNVISTRKLENTLLQPGESADVEVTLTWINGTNNMGLKTNIAEISEDYNDQDVPDKDSTPDNQVPGEDDMDEAPVLLSVSTGQARIYFALGFAVLITIASGIVFIKKFVL